MTDIYSDIWGEILFTDYGDVRLYLYGPDSTRHRVALIIPNKLAMVKLRDYLTAEIRKIEHGSAE